MNILKYSREIERIEKFETSLTSYYLYKDLHKSPNLDQMLKLKELREVVNTLTAEVEEYVNWVGITTRIPPSQFSEMFGQNKQVDLFENRFDFDSASQPLVFATDILEKAIGKYKFLQKIFIREIIDPRFWIREIIRFPFWFIMPSIGVDPQKIKKYEQSILGKSYKLIASIITLVVAVDYFINELFDIRLLKLAKFYFLEK